MKLLNEIAGLLKENKILEAFDIMDNYIIKFPGLRLDLYDSLKNTYREFSFEKPQVIFRVFNLAETMCEYATIKEEIKELEEQIRQKQKQELQELKEQVKMTGIRQIDLIDLMEMQVQDPNNGPMVNWPKSMELLELLEKVGRIQTLTFTTEVDTALEKIDFSDFPGWGWDPMGPEWQDTDETTPNIPEEVRDRLKATRQEFGKRLKKLSDEIRSSQKE